MKQSLVFVVWRGLLAEQTARLVGAQALQPVCNCLVKTLGQPYVGGKLAHHFQGRLHRLANEGQVLGRCFTQAVSGGVDDLVNREALVLLRRVRRVCLLYTSPSPRDS